MSATYTQSFPTKSLLPLSAGLAFWGVFLGLNVLLLNVGRSHGQSYLEALSTLFSKGEPKLALSYALSPLGGGIGFWFARDLFSFIAGKRDDIVIDGAQFTIRNTSHRFDEIQSLMHPYGENELRVRLRSGAKQVIRERLYPQFGEILETFFSRTEQRLLAETRQRLQAGEVAFGDKVRLSRTTLTLKNRSISLGDIKKVRIFRGNENGSDYEELVVEALDDRKGQIETRFIENLNVLLMLLEEVCPNMKSGL